jgi:predicted phosphoribosyltransferase
MGAIASGMVRVLNRDVRLRPAKTGEMGRRERQYRDSRILQDLEHTIVILTDDGPATDATMRAAVMSLRQRNIARCSRAPTCAYRISGTVQTHFRRLNQQGGTHPLKYLKNLRHLRLLHEKRGPPMQDSRRTT